MAERLDMAIFSVGSLESVATSYRTGRLSKFGRDGLLRAGAVGDVLHHVVDEDGRLVDHPISERTMSVDLAWLRRTPERVPVSGDHDKVPALGGAIRELDPTVL